MNKVFSNTVLRNPWLSFVYALMILNGVLMGLYFSGSALMQSIIVPTVSGLDEGSWREFGLLEMLQNVFLISILSLLIYALINQKERIDKVLYLLALMVFTFLFLEEIDYGLHYYELYSGELMHDKPRNWHNQISANGDQNTRKIKRITDGLMVLVFVFLPLLSKLTIKGRSLKGYAFVPVNYFIYALISAVVLSKLAHTLDDAGFGVINGAQGKLASNISEFRETSIYYICVLYMLQLVSCPSLFSKCKTND